MTLPLINFNVLNEKQSFGANVSLENKGISYGNLSKVLKNKDTYLRDSSIYSLKSENELKSIYENSSGNFGLYAKVNSGGEVAWIKVESNEAMFSSAAELYLKRKIGGTYDSIYGLVGVNVGQVIDRFPGTRAPDFGCLASAIFFAVSSLHRKVLMLHINDVDIINDEQKKLCVQMRAIELMMNDLRTVDGDKVNSHTKSPNFDVIAFMVSRNLLTITSSYGIINKNVIDAFRTYISDPTSENRDSAAKSLAMAQMNMDSASVLQDVLRVYSEQIANDQSVRQTQIQMQLQLSQENISTATNFLEEIEKLKSGLVANVR
ncbi:MAG: hypothetical protein LBS68_00605 [Puniceicoccales bacterium]|jgi:hypothetical protein|nr:hypothetical protein [Puniceicoccales bacterium]